MSKAMSANDYRTPQEKEAAAAKAEESFKRKAEQARDGKVAMQEYEAAGHATPRFDRQAQRVGGRS